MPKLPQVLSLVVCERVLIDVLRQDAISCVNIHNGFAATSFPVIVPLIYTFAQVSASATEFNYQFRIFDSNKSEIAQSPLTKVEPLQDPNMLHKLISAIPGLQFASPGIYNFTLELNDTKVSELPFNIIKVEANVETATV